MDIGPILTHPFTLGLLLGLVFTVLACISNLKLKGELNQKSKLIADKTIYDAEAIVTGKREQERLRVENENLRIKVADLKRAPASQCVRELDVYLRAEKAMTVSAPGFASAWVIAKDKASEELTSEEKGEREAKSIFGRLIGGKRSL